MNIRTILILWLLIHLCILMLGCTDTQMPLSPEQQQDIIQPEPLPPIPTTANPYTNIILSIDETIRIFIEQQAIITNIAGGQDTLGIIVDLIRGKDIFIELADLKNTDARNMMIRAYGKHRATVTKFQNFMAALSGNAALITPTVIPKTETLTIEQTHDPYEKIMIAMNQSVHQIESSLPQIIAMPRGIQSLLVISAIIHGENPFHAIQDLKESRAKALIIDAVTENFESTERIINLLKLPQILNESKPKPVPSKPIPSEQSKRTKDDEVTPKGITIIATKG